MPLPTLFLNLPRTALPQIFPPCRYSFVLCRPVAAPLRGMGPQGRLRDRAAVRDPAACPAVRSRRSAPSRGLHRSGSLVRPGQRVPSSSIGRDRPGIRPVAADGGSRGNRTDPGWERGRAPHKTVTARRSTVGRCRALPQFDALWSTNPLSGRSRRRLAGNEPVAGEDARAGDPAGFPAGSRVTPQKR